MPIYLPRFSFWSWMWFFVGMGFMKMLFFNRFIDILKRTVGYIAKQSISEQKKRTEWTNARHVIASSIVNNKFKEKADKIRLLLRDEGLKNKNEFEGLIKQHVQNKESQYFYKLGLYCGLLSVFRSVKEEFTEGYYRLKILGVPVVSVRDEELSEAESSIEESVYSNHDFIENYLLH